MMGSCYSLYWRPAARGVLAVELAAACARFRERTSQTATRIETAVGEAIDAPGLAVVESARVRPGCWMIGGGE